MQRSALCRSRRELSNKYLFAKFGFDTAENEPCKVCPLSAYRSPRSDSQTSRAQKAESITEKEASKADLDLKVENASEKKTSLEQDLLNIKE